MKCEICGRIPFPIIIHHINGNHKDNQDNNILGICFDCHTAIHRGLKKYGEKPHHRNRRRMYRKKNQKNIRAKYLINKYRKIWVEEKDG